MDRLKVKNRYLTKGEMPFFWLSDTAWELCHKASREEVINYLDIRVSQGFNIVQIVVLSEFDGLRTPNFYGSLPLIPPEYEMADLTQEYSYWHHLDFIIFECLKREIYVALLPSWGDKINGNGGAGPNIFGTKNAYNFGKWIGDRYKNCDNLVWVLGGDRVLRTLEQFLVIEKMVEGIKESGASQIMSFHPHEEISSARQLHNANWLDFNMVQTGHVKLNNNTDEKVYKDYIKAPLKPILNSEPLYEDHPIAFNPENGYFDNFDVRKDAYYSVFSGSLGITYGHHSVWSINREQSEYFPLIWDDALTRQGAYEMQHLKNLILSTNMDKLNPNFHIFKENFKGANKQVAINDDKYVYIYSPNGLYISLNSEIISGEWYSPRTGKYINAINENGKFYPPTTGRGEDWVLKMQLD